MRTVSFSTPAVQQKMNQDFVCVAVNTEGDPSAGSSQAHAPSDQAGQCTPGIGNQNVQLVFMTPEARIFHTASGFRDGLELAREMDFANQLFDKIKESPRLAEDTVRNEHHQKMLQAGYTPARLKRSGDRHQVSSRSTPDRTDLEKMRSSLFDVLITKTQESRMLDYNFSQKYPMLEWERFEENPRLLVGNAVTAFASGHASGGRIGGNASRNRC